MDKVQITLDFEPHEVPYYQNMVESLGEEKANGMLILLLVKKRFGLTKEDLDRVTICRNEVSNDE